MLDLNKFTIPPGAKWVAADANGKVYAYADEPRQIYLAELWTADDGEYWKVGKIDAATIDWRQSLTPVQPAGATNETA